MSQLANRPLEALPEQHYQLSQAEINQLLDQINDWHIEQSTPEPQLIRSFKFNNYRKALNFTIKIGELAEQFNHHPSILLEWGEVRVCWWTHKIGGLHINDFIMAARTDQVFSET